MSWVGTLVRVALIPPQLLPIVLWSLFMRLLYLISPSAAKSLIKRNMDKQKAYEQGHPGLKKAFKSDEEFGKGFIASLELTK